MSNLLGKPKSSFPEEFKIVLTISRIVLVDIKKDALFNSGYAFHMDLFLNASYLLNINLDCENKRFIYICIQVFWLK